MGWSEMEFNGTLKKLNHNFCQSRARSICLGNTLAQILPHQIQHQEIGVRKKKKDPLTENFKEGEGKLKKKNKGDLKTHSCSCLKNRLRINKLHCTVKEKMFIRTICKTNMESVRLLRQLKIISTKKKRQKRGMNVMFNIMKGKIIIIIIIIMFLNALFIFLILSGKKLILDQRSQMSLTHWVRN